MKYIILSSPPAHGKNQKVKKVYSSKNDIQSFDELLDAKYGAPGTAQRTKAEEDAFAYYSSFLLRFHP